jgi:hypothetical protein
MCRVSEPAAAVPESPTARRGIRSRWRDPRLLLGVLLVLASVVVGARVLTGVDDATPVWAANRDLPAGSQVSADDVDEVDVSFGSGVGTAYVSATTPLPSGMILVKPVAAHELLTQSAVDTAAVGPVAQLPLGVESLLMPNDLAPGDVVDVWVVPSASVNSSRASSPRAYGPPHALSVLPGVIVVATDSLAALGGSTRNVVVGLDGPQLGRLATVLPRLVSGTIVLVRHGG